MFLFFNDPATTEIYPLSLHDALPIFDLVAMVVDDLVACGAEPLFLQDYVACGRVVPERIASIVTGVATGCTLAGAALVRSEEHTSELQSRQYLVCRLLLEKKKKRMNI